MDGFEIRDVDVQNIDDLINLCVPPDKRMDPLFIKGVEEKKRWALVMLKKFGSFAKIAYMENKPVGMIQFVPKIDEKVVEITCIFVPDKNYQRRGVGKKLLKELIDEMREPKEWFKNEPPLALVTHAFAVPGFYPQHEFFTRMGFKRVREDNPFLLYYPMRENYVYKPREDYIPQREDVGKVLIFYDASCPFCIYFNEKIKNLIREVDPDIPIRIVNMLIEEEEVKKRGKVPFCIVNTHPIKTSFFEKEKFQKEVKEAIKKPPLQT